MTELWSNQRGEIGRQHMHVKAALAATSVHVLINHVSPTHTDDETSQMDHDIAAYAPYSFLTMSWVLLRPLPTEVQG